MCTRRFKQNPLDVYYQNLNEKKKNGKFNLMIIRH